MPRYRVGEGGLRVITDRGTYSLPPGTELDEPPERYDGTLEVIAWKRIDGYEDKRIVAGRDLADKGEPR